jgi:outer membrane protein, protease secretion system
VIKRPTFKVSSLILSITLGLIFSLAEGAESNLNTLFSHAKVYDPKYATAKADKTLSKFQSTLAYSAFAPTLNFDKTEYMNGTSSSLSTLTLTQPLVSMEKMDQLKEGAPKELLADAVYMTQEQDLASRVFTAVAGLITQNEAVKSNQVRVNTLKKQLDRIKRMIQLGYGTITDERDIKVRYEQAVATGVTLEINRRNAITQIMTLSRDSVLPKDFDLPESHNLAGQFDINQLMAKVQSSNPNLLAARKTEEISTLEAKRQRDQILPTLSLQQTNRWTEATGGNDSVTMLNFSMPIDATRVIGNLSSSASEQKAVETRRQVEEQTTMLTSQLYESVVMGREALENKRVAVEAAKLSVEANEKSLTAGVRTTIEVLNSIDTLFQAKNDYATTALNLGNAYLNLLLITGEAPGDAIAQTQQFLFGA